MPKSKKRKRPISEPDTTTSSSHKPRASRNVIRRFHALTKTQAHLKNKPNLDPSEAEELAKVNEEIEGLGGLKSYQQMSAIGQGNDRGGGTEKVFIQWLKELGMHQEREEKLRCVGSFHFTGEVFSVDILYLLSMQIIGSGSSETRQLPVVQFMDPEYTYRPAVTTSCYRGAGFLTFGLYRKRKPVGRY